MSRTVVEEHYPSLGISPIQQGTLPASPPVEQDKRPKPADTLHCTLHSGFLSWEQCAISFPSAIKVPFICSMVPISTSELSKALEAFPAPSVSPRFMEGQSAWHSKDILFMRKEATQHIKWPTLSGVSQVPSFTLPSWSGIRVQSPIWIKEGEVGSPSIACFISSLDLWQASWPLWTSISRALITLKRKRRSNVNWEAEPEFKPSSQSLWP